MALGNNHKVFSISGNTVKSKQIEVLNKEPNNRQPNEKEKDDGCLSIKDFTLKALKSLNASFGVSVTVIGEVTQVSDRLHLYFTLTDENDIKKAVKNPARLSIAVFNWNKNIIDFDLSKIVIGIKLKVTGSIDIYSSNIQLSNITKISYANEGDKLKQLEALRSELEAKGYFAKERKRKVPIFLQKVALLTSRVGEASHDFIKGLKDHYGRFYVELVDIPVQGVSNALKVAGEIRRISESKDYSLIILMRGGGAKEDFDIFNSREVLDAIFSSTIPLITAIGHTNDHCFADDVADFFCATPTDAGNMIASNYNEIDSLLNYAEIILTSVPNTYISNFNTMLSKLEARFQGQSPLAMLKNLTERLYKAESSVRSADHNIRIALNNSKSNIAELELRLNKAAAFYFERSKNSLKFLNERLEYSHGSKLASYIANRKAIIENRSLRLEQIQNRINLLLKERERNIEELFSKASFQMQERVKEYRRRLEKVETALSHLNPENVLDRGYAIIIKGSEVVQDALSLEAKDKVTIKLRDGRVAASIDNVEID